MLNTKNSRKESDLTTPSTMSNPCFYFSYSTILIQYKNILTWSKPLSGIDLIIREVSNPKPTKKPAHSKATSNNLLHGQGKTARSQNQTWFVPNTVVENLPVLNYVITLLLIIILTCCDLAQWRLCRPRHKGFPLCPHQSSQRFLVPTSERFLPPSSSSSCLLLLCLYCMVLNNLSTTVKEKTENFLTWS